MTFALVHTILRRARCQLVFMLLAGAALIAPAQERRIIRLSATEQLTHLTAPAQTVLKEAYGRLGLKIEVTYLPISRGLQETNAGHFDGDLARIAGLEREFSALMMVPTAVGAISLCIYAPAHIYGDFQSLEALKSSSLRIGIRKGSRIANQLLGQANVTPVRTNESLFEMLALERVDIVVAPTGLFQEVRPQLPPRVEVKLRGMRALSPFETQDIYHYLHVSNVDLVEPLSRELLRMSRDGSMKKIWDRYVY